MLTLLVILFSFILGSCVGSFLLVVVERSEKNKSFLWGRSQCDFCHHTLNLGDLVPLFSFLALGGKCRYCQKKLSMSYWIVEAVSGVLFVLPVLFLSHLSLVSWFIIGGWWILLSSFFIIFLSDFWYGIIPDGATLIITLLGVLRAWFILHTLPLALLTGVGSCLIFLTLFLLTRGRGMGLGDVKLAGALGLLLSWPQITVALYSSFISGALLALVLIIQKKKKLHGSTLAFGPFLVVGALIALTYGDMIWNWYIHLL